MAVNRILVGDIEITGISNLTSGNVNLATSLLNDVLEMDTLDCDFNSQLDSSTILATIGEKVVYYHGDQQRQTLYVDSIKRTGPSSYHLYAICIPATHSSPEWTSCTETPAAPPFVYVFRLFCTIWFRSYSVVPAISWP